MNQSRKIVKLAPSPAMLASGRRGNKAPTLAEAYEHFTGKSLERPHDAMGDLIACKAVYFGIQSWLSAHPEAREA